jgi:hypothetical protein
LIPGASWADLIKVKTDFHSSNPRNRSFFHGLELYFIRDSPFGFTFYFIGDSVDRKFTSYRILSLFWSKPKVKTQFHLMKVDLQGLLNKPLLVFISVFCCSKTRTLRLSWWIGNLFPNGFFESIRIYFHWRIVNEFK